MPSPNKALAIAESIRTRILDGTLRPGARLLPQAEACGQYRVAAATIRRAYDMLRMWGLIEPPTTRGTFVAGPVSATAAERVAEFARTGTALTGGEASYILHVGPAVLEEHIAVRLGLEPGASAHARTRLVMRGTTPVHLSTSYYPDWVVELTPELTEQRSTGGSRELAAARAGVAQARALEEVTSRMPSPEEAAWLKLVPAVAVTQVTRTVTLADDRVLEVAVKLVGGQTVLRWPTEL